MATFHTLPASASLLARLTVAKLKRVDWPDADAIGKLYAGDFAYGTGALPLLMSGSASPDKTRPR